MLLVHIDCIHRGNNTKFLVINPKKNVHNLYKIIIMYGIYKINAETSIMNESNYKDFNFPNL